jgi:hypothetical protein
MRALIIPCGGNGSRMSNFCFPKCLLPVKQRPMLFRIIEVWKRFVDEVVLVHNPRNEQILRRYVSTYFEGDLSIKFVLQPRPTGTYNAVRLGLRATAANRAILNWSDVCLHDAPDIAQDAHSNFVLTTDIGDHCRWVFRQQQFACRERQPFTDGGVYGVFLLNDLDGAFRADFKTESSGETEILVAFNGDSFRGVTVEGFTDIGEEKRYRPEDRLATRDASTRAFGSCATIEFQDSVVVKGFSDEQMQANESNWYRAVNFSFLPKVHSSKPLVLERLDAEPYWLRLERNPSLRLEIEAIYRVSELARTIHSSRPSTPADFGACQRQYLDKTIERLKRVDFLFQDFNRNGITVNGRAYPNPLDLLDLHAGAVQAIFPTRFHFIHGDLQLSNCLIDPADRLFLIDPRGSFGGTPLFGDALYDFAKLYYSFCGGYDIFSTGRNRFVTDGAGVFILTPLLPPDVLARRRLLFERELRGVEYVRRGMVEVDIAHAIIWLSAVDYTANDVLSSMYAYLLGTKLLSNALAAASIERERASTFHRAAA